MDVAQAKPPMATRHVERCENEEPDDQANKYSEQRGHTRERPKNDSRHQRDQDPLDPLDLLDLLDLSDLLDLF